MAPKFGTSGLRGLVTELTDPVVAGHVAAFLEDADTDGTVLIGQDLRASSPRIAGAVAAAVSARGHRPFDCGVLPTPALATLALERGTAAIMVTGSHIPDDRNGVKFYRADGEITKADEAAIVRNYAPLDLPAVHAPKLGDALRPYLKRYTGFFAPDALAGLTIGIYEHSSAARDILKDILTGLGAETVSLGRSDKFIPVDTEAVDPETRDMLAGWTRDHGLDAIVSTDGDADRPMLTDAAGRIVAGDRLGPITAAHLGADIVVTPVSSNTCVDLMEAFRVVRTQIGSPYVLAGMAENPGRVVGYEPNGGFLLGFAAQSETGRMAPLPTRDCVLPILAVLAEARARGTSVADLSAALPARFTAADRLTGVASDKGLALVEQLKTDADLRATLFGRDTPEDCLDLTDGIRAVFPDGQILHFRPSGNAPEFRVYAEADSEETAQAQMRAAMARVAEALD